LRPLPLFKIKKVKTTTSPPVKVTESHKNHGVARSICGVLLNRLNINQSIFVYYGMTKCRPTT